MCTSRLRPHFNVLYIPMATSFKASGLKEPAKKQPNFIADQSQFSSVLSVPIHELKTKRTTLKRLSPGQHQPAGALNYITNPLLSCPRSTDRPISHDNTTRQGVLPSLANSLDTPLIKSPSAIHSFPPLRAWTAAYLNTFTMAPPVRRYLEAICLTVTSSRL